MVNAALLLGILLVLFTRLLLFQTTLDFLLNKHCLASCRGNHLSVAVIEVLLVLF